LCAALAACGGGGSADTPNRQAGSGGGQGVAVGEPNGGVPVASEYVKLAVESTCATDRNQLFLVDDKYVFWAREGACADMSAARVLMGATPDAVLCRAEDTVAGPRSSCTNEAVRPLFETMSQNLDKPDLGLGAGHKVAYIPFLPKEGHTLSFVPVAEDGFSGIHGAREVVVKDAAAWSALWAEHGKPAAEAPAVDFGRTMLAGVFLGDLPQGCTKVAVARAYSRAGKLVVDYVAQNDSQVQECAAAVQQPMQVVALPRVDAPVEFNRITVERLAMQTIGGGFDSGVHAARQVVVKDSGAWAALWAEHAGTGAAVPEVDFSKKMVIGIFAGGKPNPCYGTGILRVTHTGGKTVVVVRNTVPQPEIACPAVVAYPSHIVVVDRRDGPVEWDTIAHTSS
jgi:hypothetical protein